MNNRQWMTMNEVSVYRQVGVCTLLHLLVDGLCICSLYLQSSSLPLPSLAAIFITYNTLAFLTQPLTGAWADRMKRKHWMLIMAVLLLTLAVASTLFAVSARCTSPGVAIVPVQLGLGNSLFHVWGGKQMVIKTGNDIRALGVFVSTGVLGLAIGLICRSWALLYGLLLAYVGLAIVYVHSELVSARTRESENARIDQGRIRPPLTPPTQEGKQALMLVLALMLFVGCRSFVGEVF